MWELLIGSVLIFFGTRAWLRYIRRIGQPWESIAAPSSDQAETKQGFLIGIVLGLFLTIFWDVPSYLLPFVFGLGAFVQSLLEQKRELARDHAWRTQVERLAAQTSVPLKGVRLVHSKSRTVIGRHDGTIELPTAMLRSTGETERAFLIGQALWDIKSGYVHRKTQKRRNVVLVGIGLLIIFVPFFVVYQDFTGLFIGLIGLCLAGITSKTFIEARRDPEILEADQFALALTGDLSTALRVIDTEQSQCKNRFQPPVYGEYERRRRSLKDWWAARQHKASASAPAPQVQKLGGP
jgi:hypothetical protein